MRTLAAVKFAVKNLTAKPPKAPTDRASRRFFAVNFAVKPRENPASQPPLYHA